MCRCVGCHHRPERRRHIASVSRWREACRDRHCVRNVVHLVPHAEGVPEPLLPTAAGEHVRVGDRRVTPHVARVNSPRPQGHIPLDGACSSTPAIATATRLLLRQEHLQEERTAGHRAPCAPRSGTSWRDSDSRESRQRTYAPGLLGTLRGTVSRHSHTARAGASGGSSQPRLECRRTSSRKSPQPPEQYSLPSSPSP